MSPALLGALVAALAYGAATVLQAAGVRSVAALPAGSSVRARVGAGRLYALGLALDLFGFLASVAALRSLPLFLVESAVAGSVAVTALLSVLFLRIRLAGREWAALLGVVAGLVLLAVVAVEGPARAVPNAGQWAVLGAVAVVAALVGRGHIDRSDRRAAVLLAAASGLGFGGVGVAARIVPFDGGWSRALGEPALWAVVGHGLLGTVAYALALDRGRVTTVAAVTFAVETVVPAGVGLWWLGDSVRPHLGVVAAVGFAVTLLSCIALAARSEPSG